MNSNRHSEHTFSQIPKADIPRSVFDRSHTHKTTFNEGFLVPFYVDEALPGDTFKLKASLFARLATPIFPIMDNLYLETFYFAVPSRILWDNWKAFNGEQTNPDNAFPIPHAIPTTTIIFGSSNQQGLFDYMGLPVVEPISISIAVNSLPLRAYNSIYNEWFRDENLINSRPTNKGDGPDDPSDYVLQRRGKRHDYFTSCLPWPQKGIAVNLPLGTSAPVKGNGIAMNFVDGSQNLYMAYAGGPILTVQTPPKNIGDTVTQVNPTNDHKAIGLTTNGPNSGLIADLSNATSATINSMRQAFQIQKLLERDARGGTRYTEIIRSHFGVISPDMRLQRPEYLGGSSCRININPVQQTSSTDSVSPLGNLAAFGVAHENNSGFSKSFTEHMYIIGIVNVRAELTYQQGLRKMWSRSTRYDFYWPALSHIGEQAVLNKEIYCKGNSDDPNVFGYQERWAEYRYYPSQITGYFRSTVNLPLDSWHLAQKFTSLPTLGQTFIEENAPMDRVLAVNSFGSGRQAPHIIFDSFIQLHCARPMPVYSVPGMMDHF